MKNKEIFNLLVQNNEVISYKNLDNININKDLLNKIKPILDEIEKNKIENLDFDKFSKLADKYLFK